MKILGTITVAANILAIALVGRGLVATLIGSVKRFPFNFGGSIFGFLGLVGHMLSSQVCFSSNWRRANQVPA